MHKDTFAPSDIFAQDTFEQSSLFSQELKKINIRLRNNKKQKDKLINKGKDNFHPWVRVRANSDMKNNFKNT